MTVTVHVSVYDVPPTVMLAVMTDVPAATPETTPSLLTVAFACVPDVHVTDAYAG